MRNRHGGWMVIVAGCLVGGWVGAGAYAQEGAGPLAGPGIEVRKVPGVSGSFGTGDAGRFAARGQPVPLPVFFEALGSLGRDGAQTDLALSQEQVEIVQQEIQVFREQLRAYVEASDEQVRTLLGQLPQRERGRAVASIRKLERLGEMLDRVARSDRFSQVEHRKNGKKRVRPERDRNGTGMEERAGHAADRDEGFRLRFRERSVRTGDEADTMMVPMQEAWGAADGSAEARARLMELHYGAPSWTELEIRLWEVLTEPQQEVVGAALDAHLAEMQSAREEQRLAREIERRRRETSDRAPSDVLQDKTAQGVRGFGLDETAMGRVLETLESGEVPQQLWSRLPERTRQRLETLPEHERARALARMLRSRQGGSGQKPTSPPG